MIGDHGEVCCLGARVGFEVVRTILFSKVTGCDH
jgi:hypothetical protein